jgi:hypothetical protein
LIVAVAFEIRIAREVIVLKGRSIFNVFLASKKT